MKQNVIQVDHHITKYRAMVESLNVEVAELKSRLARATSTTAVPGRSDQEGLAESQAYQLRLAPLLKQRQEIIGMVAQAEVCCGCAPSDTMVAGVHGQSVLHRSTTLAPTTLTWSSWPAKNDSRSSSGKPTLPLSYAGREGGSVDRQPEARMVALFQYPSLVGEA